MRNKRKIVNDPVYGFVTIPTELIFDLVEHPVVQRLRRIMQLGLTHLVYPGARHTRLSHAIGAMHLMGRAINVLRQKDIPISEAEWEGALAAILLHDVGHGPFSHALERAVIESVPHEMLSLRIMEALNQEFHGKLDVAIEIFRGQYPKKFLSQLVAGQLDVDRLDYLMRDSFYSGVSEGIIGYDRILKMLHVSDGQLVVESKAIYSIEKFIVARRIMYWQVYLHKTVLAAEQMLVNALKRARELVRNNIQVPASEPFHWFLANTVKLEDFVADSIAMRNFAILDDVDIVSTLKSWMNHPDTVLSRLSRGLVNRKLLKISLRNQAYAGEVIKDMQAQLARDWKINREEASWFVFQRSTSNNAYNRAAEKINILNKDGSLQDIAEASDQLNISFLSQPVVKYYLCYPAHLSERIQKI